MSLARKNEGADKYDKYLGQHEKEDDQPPHDEARPRQNAFSMEKDPEAGNRQ